MRNQNENKNKTWTSTIITHARKHPGTGFYVLADEIKINLLQKNKSCTRYLYNVSFFSC